LGRFFFISLFSLPNWGEERLVVMNGMDDYEHV